MDPHKIYRVGLGPTMNIKIAIRAMPKRRTNWFHDALAPVQFVHTRNWCVWIDNALGTGSARSLTVSYASVFPSPSTVKILCREYRFYCSSQKTTAHQIRTSQ